MAGAESNTAAMAKTPQDKNNNPAPAPSGEDAAESYESTHVHTVYEAIAPHFSATRHKPWPRVSSFLASLAPGAVGLDVGCGNGKYLAVNGDLYLLGSDRSANLVALARDNDGTLEASGARPSRVKAKPGKGRKGQSRKEDGGRDGEEKDAQQQHQHQQREDAPAETQPQPPKPRTKNEVIVADGLVLPYRSSSADFAISIAVLHHLSTRQRRQLGVRAILDCLRPRTSQAGDGGHGDGDDDGGKALLFVWALEQSSSRRGWDQGASQDQLVPWVTKANSRLNNNNPPPPPPAQPQQGDQAASTSSDPASQGQDQPDKDSTWHRYYHLYKEGELEEDIRAVGGVVLDSGYERDNWWAVCARGPGESPARKT